MARIKPGNFSVFGVWSLAIRPRTLPASISPVVVGIAMAIADGGFRFLPALAALTGALLLQIGVNLANDYFDWAKGIDTAKRLGPVRVTQSGMIEPERMRRGIYINFIIVVAVGLYLVIVGGWPILVVGIASIISALAYSGGPYPIASHGLGDLFVFIFFGLIAVCGTYYVQTLYLKPTVFLAALPVGFLITAILVVNNLRDIHTDREAGKHTLAVILGVQRTRKEYAFLLLSAYVTPPVLLLMGRASWWVLLPLASLPVAISMARFIWLNEGAMLNRALAGTASLTLLFSILLSIGLILS